MHGQTQFTMLHAMTSQQQTLTISMWMSSTGDMSFFLQMQNIKKGPTSNVIALFEVSVKMHSNDYKHCNLGLVLV